MIDDSRPVRIRHAGLHDMEVVAVMAGEFFAYLATLDESDPAFDVAGTVEKLVRSGFGDRPLFYCLLAESDDQPVGYAIYSLGFWADTFQGAVFLTDLFIRDGWRSLGIGEQMMNQIAAVGGQAGCETLMWTVWTKNEASRRFYDRLGAIPMDDELLMRLDI